MELNNDTYSYRDGQLSRVRSTQNYDELIAIKVRGSDESTKWLNITATELDQIINVLVDYRIKGA